jgi:hypothetical protein
MRFPRQQDDDKLKRHLDNGGRITLESRQTFDAPAAKLAAPQPLVISFPGTEDLPRKVVNDMKVRVNIRFTHTETPNFAVLAFLNTPKADARTPESEPGFLGSIGFFDHGPQAHHAETVVRLSGGEVVKRVGRPGPMTLALVPIGYPQRQLKAQTVDVTASLELMFSKVEKLR